jgi:hypothetical protein
MGEREGIEKNEWYSFRCTDLSFEIATTIASLSAKED